MKRTYKIFSVMLILFPTLVWGTRLTVLERSEGGFVIKSHEQMDETDCEVLTSAANEAHGYSLNVEADVGETNPLKPSSSASYGSISESHAAHINVPQCEMSKLSEQHGKCKITCRENPNGLTLDSFRQHFIRSVRSANKKYNREIPFN